MGWWDADFWLQCTPMFHVNFRIQYGVKKILTLKNVRCNHFRYATPSKIYMATFVFFTVELFTFKLIISKCVFDEIYMLDLGCYIYWFEKWSWNKERFHTVHMWNSCRSVVYAVYSWFQMMLVTIHCFPVLSVLYSGMEWLFQPFWWWIEEYFLSCGWSLS